LKQVYTMMHGQKKNIKLSKSLVFLAVKNKKLSN